MRILLVADIHANPAALQAIRETYDVCFFLGDLVDYGLEPAPCIDWVRRTARYAIRGNHDHGASQNVVVTAQSGFKYLTAETRPLTRELLSPKDTRFLNNLPVTWNLTLENQKFLLVHGTPRDPLDEYAPPDAELWSRRLEGIDANVVCVGHTHIPFVLEVGDKLVVNPGSVGLPRDGDPRASYAIMENGKVEIKRIEYPIDQPISVVEQSKLPDQAKELLIEVYRSGSVKSYRQEARKTMPEQPGTGVVKPKLTLQGIDRPKPTHQGTE